jgi:hypothetical protein
VKTAQSKVELPDLATPAPEPGLSAPAQGGPNPYVVFEFRTGKELWSVRLDCHVTAIPITSMAGAASSTSPLSPP